MSITSWNEWGEGTQIEPCQAWVDPDTGAAYKDYGLGGPWLYLNITQTAASSFTQQWHARQAAAGVGLSEGGPATGDAPQQASLSESSAADRVEL